MSNVIIDFNMENSKTNPLYEQSEINECRICLEESDDLICICGCKGTAQYVHKECIEEWINRFPVNHPNHTRCQLCNEKYKLDLIDEIKINHCQRNVLSFIYVFCIILGLTIIVILIGML